MTVYFNGKKCQQLGFMHLKVDVIIFSKNKSIFDFSRLRTTIYNWKDKRSLNSHKRYLSFKNGLFFPSTLLEAPTIPLNFCRFATLLWDFSIIWEFVSILLWFLRCIHRWKSCKRLCKKNVRLDARKFWN
jgi:hypothetical protein